VRSRAHARAQRATDRVLLLLRGCSVIMRDGCSGFSARRSVASHCFIRLRHECRTDRTKREHEGHAELCSNEKLVDVNRLSNVHGCAGLDKSFQS
jgi:hypothetical protein